MLDTSADDVPLDQSWLDSGEWTVEVAGSEYPARCSLRPLYDPRNARIKM
jgi:4-methylaminobutanoate oxidase (formaldehyde-forming)